MRPVGTAICPEQTETNATLTSSMLGRRLLRESELLLVPLLIALDGKEYVVTMVTPAGTG
jgi:hypothetical protein